jgi:hypothetical protein
MKLLGPSAFGPLKFRPIGVDGVEGDWQPLVNLVRLPELKQVVCPAAESKPSARTAASEKDSGGGPSAGDGTAAEKVPNENSLAQEQKCVLSGDKLFLIDAVSADPDFTSSVAVPDGFVDAALAIPRPKEKTLYIKLRDDPATVNTAVVPTLANQP